MPRECLRCLEYPLRYAASRARHPARGEAAATASTAAGGNSRRGPAVERQRASVVAHKIFTKSLVSSAAPSNQ